MQVKTEAIVLSALRYSEADLIVKLFTREEGLKSYLVRGVLKSKRGKIRASYFQIFNLLDIDATHKSNNSLHYLKEIKSSHYLQSIHTDVIKGGVITFLAEIVCQILIDSEPDGQLFDYLKQSVLWLDSNNNIALFHHLFLLKLTNYLGCYPDTTNEELTEFNLEEGNFASVSKTVYTIKGETLASFKLLLGIDFDELNGISIPKQVRKNLLNILLLYYNFHVTGYKKPKSLPVLQELFN